MNDNKHQKGYGDIDDLLNELKDTTVVCRQTVTVAPSTIQPEINAASINKFVMEKTAFLIQQGVDALERSKLQVQTTGNNEDIEAYSKLLQATTGAIDALNKVNIQDKKEKIAKELKKMDVDSKAALPKQLAGGNTTNNIILATRADIMQKIFDDAEQKVLDDDVIEAEYSEVDHSESADV